MPVVPFTDDVLPQTYGPVKYPNPFFDLANSFIPKNIKVLFRFCRTYFYTNSFLRNVVTKLTEYPITDIQYVSNIDKGTKTILDNIFNQKIKLKSFLIEVGLDYFTYGNAIISASMKPKRFLKCSKCGAQDLLENVEKLKLRNFEFYADCKACASSNIKMSAHDEIITSIENFRLHRWAPENIDIEFNPMTGSTTYYYNIPQKIKQQIIAGNVTFLKDIPLVFLESLKSKRKIIMDANNIFHLKYPTLAEDDMGWGKPLILPALKDIYYLQTLRRGNEAIANEHIVPKKAIYPANTTTLDPYSMHPDTFVQSEYGIRMLKDLKEGDRLFTYNNTFTSIVKMVERDLTGVDEMYSIHSFGLRSVDTKVNSIHPFRVWDENSQTHVWKQTKELTVGDFTAYPVKNMASSPLVELNTRDYIDTNYRQGTEIIAEKIAVTDELLKLFGYYISEGHLEKNGLIGFAFHENETKYHDEVISELSKLTNNKISKTIRENSCAIRVCSVTLNSLLDALFGHGFDNKRLYKLTKKLDRAQLVALLAGIYNGDGTFFYEKAVYPRLNLKLANQELIYEIRDILLSLGYYPTLVKDDNAWCVKLSGAQAERFAVELDWLDEVTYVDDEYKAKKYFFRNNFVYSKIEKLNQIPDHTVLSIEVADETHSYLSIGYINKNTQMNLGKWKAQMELQIKKWKTDPNHIGVFPIPIGYQELGGNARMLLLTPEMKFIEENIINSLGVPLEFIKGGASWTGSSISLRIVENHFLGYRELLEDFINHFIVQKLHDFLNLPMVELKFKKFKMNDDSEAKQLALQLNASGKLSDATLLEDLGYDYEYEDEANVKLRTKMTDEQIAAQEKEAEAQGKAQVILAKYQVRAQKAAEDEVLKIKTELFQDELARENIGMPEDPAKLIEKYAIELSNLPPAQANIRLKVMAEQMPVTFGMVTAKLQEYQMNYMQQMQQSGMGEEKESKTPAAPRAHSPNKQKPGTREQDKVKIRDHEKTKGQTRGEV